MEDDTLSFEEHRRQREENASSVRCARCREWIIATAVRCPKCGVYFEGEAQDFTHSSERVVGRDGQKWWVIAVAVLLLVTMTLGLLGLW